MAPSQEADSGVLAVIQCRMKSKRLPGKALLKLGEVPVLEHVYARTSKIRGVDSIVVATTTNKEDDAIVGWAANASVEVYRGSSDDVAGRILAASEGFGVKFIARVTADCPLLDPEISSLVVLRATSDDLDFCCNYLPPTFPDGLDFSVFKRNTLLRDWSNGMNRHQQEHVTTGFEKANAQNSAHHIISPVDYSKQRWTLDNSEDYAFLSRLASETGSDLVNMNFASILDFLEKNPDIAKLQSVFKRNYGHSTPGWSGVTRNAKY
jgi:spore coat polysaccharide biosynthesis protein SpsF (cytidylyltransferase family)